ncbi:hypothetical protein F2Q69_00047050 [Brassica cretica]|uniref:Uncharacterized protein n=1 Tax=Brassica cretica TaxID=69181 RepID=A0A8S9Q6V5_BRACR|nr:hypothetical protein F2Q69_00047050 [Brassica cretica]
MMPSSKGYMQSCIWQRALPPISTWSSRKQEGLHSQTELPAYEPSVWQYQEVNDIDPVGPDSGTGVTPTRLTGASDATESSQTQQIPPTGTSSQDRSLPINQTSTRNELKLESGISPETDTPPMT